MVYRLAPRQHSHGVVAPFIGAETVFAPALTRYDIALRHDAGARTTTAPADGDLPVGADLLFLIDPDGALLPATTARQLTPRPGDALVLLGPANQRNGISDAPASGRPPVHPAR